jgi:hypothetical protein
MQAKRLWKKSIRAELGDITDGPKSSPDADLYDPLSMPPPPVKGHSELDRAGDFCFSPLPFENDRLGNEYLFALYEKLTAPLMATARKSPQEKRVNYDYQNLHKRCGELDGSSSTGFNLCGFRWSAVSCKTQSAQVETCATCSCLACGNTRLRNLRSLLGRI